MGENLDLNPGLYFSILWGKKPIFSQIMIGN